MNPGWILLSLLCAPGPWGSAAERISEEPRRQIERALERWRAGSLHDEELTEALARLGAKAAPSLCAFLDAKPRTVPVEPIARALGRLRSREAVPTLARLAGSGAAADRLAAVEALDAIGSRECIPILVTALEDPDAAVADRAESALLAPDMPRGPVVDSLGRHILKSGAKERMARLLGSAGGEAAHDALIALLNSPDEASILAALQGLMLLSRAEDCASVKALLRATTTDEVRKQACIFLAQVRCDDALRELIDLLGGPDRELARKAH